MEYVIEFSNVGLGEEGSNGGAAETVMRVVYCSDHAFRGVEMC